MENTRIPKPTSGMKPMRDNYPGITTTGIVSKLLPSVTENKTAKTTLASNVLERKIPLQARNALRRRSKSVTDLRPQSSKPISALKPVMKTVTKGNTIRTGQKRPSDKSEEEVKTKVQKVKIPDWDYKSRFHELQKKHAAGIEEIKEYRSKLADLKNIEQDYSNKQKQIELLEVNKKIISQENKDLQIENHKVKNELANIRDAYQTVKTQYDQIIVENKENIMKLDELQKLYTETQSEFNKLTFKCRNLEMTIQDLEMTVQELKVSLEEHETLRRILHNNVQDLKGNIRVFCRVRPPINDEENSKLLCSIHFPDENCIEIKKSRESTTTGGKLIEFRQEFHFDKVFPPEASQSEVFEELSQLVQSALDGFHVCVFAYGQTGSGKTYTMQGSSCDHGMIPRTIDLLFEKIEKLKHGSWSYTVSASFLEIYNENVKDLLEPNSTYNYELRYNEGRGVSVTNLKIISILSANEMKKHMEDAHKNRAVAATDFNLHSSRSHAVTKIDVEGYNEVSKVTYRGSINLVDLAGSESAKTSSAERLTETKNINKSLSTLGSVMLALHNKDSHIPYRNSKLTFLLQSCLGGNSKTLMFVNISPFEDCYNESVNSLRFAAKVKDVKTHAKKNKSYAPLLQTSKSTL